MRLLLQILLQIGLINTIVFIAFVLLCTLKNKKYSKDKYIYVVSYIHLTLILSIIDLSLIGTKLI